MTKIVYNACYGGFSLSDKAIERYLDLKGWSFQTEGEGWSKHYVVEEDPNFYCRSIDRADPLLIRVVEELGPEEASGDCAKLVIEELPEGTAYRIDEYDGYESLNTRDMYNWSIA